jgi:hypothetical protein
MTKEQKENLKRLEQIAKEQERINGPVVSAMIRDAAEAQDVLGDQELDGPDC